MNEISLEMLSLTLVLLLFLSAFFSASETGMMTLNRYRLKHLSKTSDAAKRVQTLLDRPDRLLGLILLGNNFVNIFASAIASLIAIRLLGDYGVVVASFLLTIFILIFGEVSPKTLAALYPEKIAFPASYVLTILLKIFYPIVYLINMISNGILKLLGASLQKQKNLSLSKEEFYTLIHETSGRISTQYRSMLLGILELEKMTIDDIMVPRNEIIGIDINDDWSTIQAQLASTPYTFLPVYEDDLNDIIGILHAKHALHLFANKDIVKEYDPKIALKKALVESYFVPEGTNLATQLLNFKTHKKRFALVVDEYGVLQGLITLEGIFEEIVGEFTTDIASDTQTLIHPQKDGSLIVDGSIFVRELNRLLPLNLPIESAKTLSGLIIEHLETIPDNSVCCKINGIPMEIIQVHENKIKSIKIMPLT